MPYIVVTRSRRYGGSFGVDDTQADAIIRAKRGDPKPAEVVIFRTTDPNPEVSPVDGAVCTLPDSETTVVYRGKKYPSKSA